LGNLGCRTLLLFNFILAAKSNNEKLKSNIFGLLKVLTEVEVFIFLANCEKTERLYHWWCPEHRYKDRCEKP
jgi:hypothetical protein